MIIPIIIWLVSFMVFAEIVKVLWYGDHNKMIKYQGYVALIAATVITMYTYNYVM